MPTGKTIAIIGAGPVGLAAAAHALERNLTPIVLEAGSMVGHAVDQWAQVSMFSPWQYNIDRAAGRLLASIGWTAPPDAAYPTGGELVERYLRPLAASPVLREHIRTDALVISIARAGLDKVKTPGRAEAKFEIRYRTGSSLQVDTADAVIDASGTWSSANPAGVNGIAAIGEPEAQAAISYRMPDVLGRDRKRYAGRTVAVLGSGHSAIGTLIDLARLAETEPATEFIWLVRGTNVEKAFGGGRNDQLEARGALGLAIANLIQHSSLRVVTDFGVTRISQTNVGLQISAGDRSVTADELIVATGLRPDFSFLRELRLNLDPALECPSALAPLIDPNEHSCGTVRPHGARELSHPEPGFYIAGMKSYGRAPTFLMLTGYEQVRSIVADIAGDKAAAARVELVLPETGVCSHSPVDATAQCCGGPPRQNKSACCAADETAKADGKAGCGCGNTPQEQTAAACCG